MFVFSMAGHVDHGKSSFLKALTNQDPDRLREEKERGMTIDLNFLHWKFDDKIIGIVDVPGHEDFLRNMIAGISSVDAFLFIVACDDGWMPQSEEHLQLLRAFGLGRGVFILSKTDLVSRERTLEVFAQVESKIKQNFKSEVPIFLFAKNDLEKLQAVKEGLKEFIASLPRPKSNGQPKIWVDRVFYPKGIGCVATGTLRDGELKVGEKIFSYPNREPFVVKSLQSYYESKESVEPTSRIAVQLGQNKKGEVHRGVLLGRDLQGKVAKDFFCAVELFPRKKLFKKNIEAKIYFGTQVVTAVFIPFAEHPLPIFKVKIKKPEFWFPFERFVIRSAGEEVTLGVGTFLDPWEYGIKKNSVLEDLKNWDGREESYPGIRKRELNFQINPSPPSEIAPAKLSAFLSQCGAIPFSLEKKSDLALAAQLVLQEKLVPLKDNYFIRADSFTQYSKMVEAHLAAKSTASTSELRKVLSLSRNDTVRVLEKLDSLKITTFKDNSRRLLRL